MEKLTFDDENVDAQLQQTSTSHKLIQQNDIYHVLLSDSHRRNDKLDNQKVTIIYPATQKHVDKYSKANISLFRETPQKYNDIVKPYIDSLPEKETKWWAFTDNTSVINSEKDTSASFRRSRERDILLQRSRIRHSRRLQVG